MFGILYEVSVGVRVEGIGFAGLLLKNSIQVAKMGNRLSYCRPFAVS